MRGDAAERFGGRKQFVDIVDAQNASAPEGRAVNIVCACKRARVRRRRAGSAAAASRLDDDDGLDARGPPRRRHERLRVVDRFDVHEDRARRGIDGEPVEQIIEVHVSRIANRHKA